MPIADLLRLMAVVLSVMAGAAILSVIRLHWKAWRAAKACSLAQPLIPKLIQQWRTWPALRRQHNCSWQATRSVLRLNRLAVMEAGDSPGLTPFHVWGVATAHAMLLSGITAAMIDQLGSTNYEAMWRIPFYIIAPLITLVALFAIGLRQRRQRHNAKEAGCPGV